MFLIFRDLKIPPAAVALSAEESRHARALRLRAGDSVFLGDGHSRRYRYVLAADGRSIECPAAPVAEDAPAPVIESPTALYTALPEGRRFDWLLQKATELGVTLIQPILTEYGEKRGLNLERARRIVLEAASQSRRFRLPEIRDILTLPRAIEELVAGGGSVVVLDPRGDRRVRDLPPSDAPAYFVGPEGGFSAGELDLLRQSGAAICRVNDSCGILRVETAALAALAWRAMAG
jgi:16S rRNA (uracil1498-N3)-methyltransferase